MISGVPLCESAIYIWKLKLLLKRILLAAEAKEAFPSPSVVGKRRGRQQNNFKGSIGWFCHSENVTNPLLYPFYTKHEERLSQLDGDGTAIILIEVVADSHLPEV